MTFHESPLSHSSAYVIGRRAMRQERLNDLGWTLPLAVSDGREMAAIITTAYEQYRVYYPDDPLTLDDLRDALGPRSHYEAGAKP